MKIKSKVFQGVMLVALTLAFFGYYFSVYRGDDSNISHYNRTILVLAFVNMSIFAEKNLENKFLEVLAKLNGVVLVIWVGSSIVQILIS